MLYEMPHKPSELVGAAIFTIKNDILFGIVDYYSEFLIVKKADGLLAENLIGMVKTVFAEFGLPMKIVLDAGTHYILDTFRQFCRWLNIQQVNTSSYYHWNSRQVEVCIKYTIKKCLDNNDDINLSLLQMGSTMGAGSLALPHFYFTDQSVSCYAR